MPPISLVDVRPSKGSALISGLGSVVSGCGETASVAKREGEGAGRHREGSGRGVRGTKPPLSFFPQCLCMEEQMGYFVKISLKRF